jgi:site-specific recombinase XerD
MLKVIFFLKSSTVDKNGELTIFARLSLNKQRISISTGKSISKDRWIFTNNLRNVLKLEKEKLIKSSLDLFQLNAEKKFNELFRIDSEVSLELLKEELSGKTNAKKNGNTNQTNIIEILDKYNKYFRRKVAARERSSASLQKYERSKELLLNFMKKNYGTSDMAALEISSSFVYKLEEFLKYESNFKGKIGIKNNSVVKYMKMYKTACNYSIKMDLIIKNPFQIYDGKLSIKDAVFLTQQELDMIEDKIFSVNRLEKVKDIFLFSCYTGYAPVDAMDLSLGNLFEDNNGNLWIMTSSAKTAIRANVPVLPSTLKIINKYKNQQQGLIPQISNQKMNAYLKEIAGVCEIEKELTFHIARHTFATTITLTNGVRVESVSKMLGHKNLRTTQSLFKFYSIIILSLQF